MKLFSSQAIETRRQRTAKKFSDLLKANEGVLIFSGEPVQKPGGWDQTYPFLPHPDYFWLTGSRRPYGVIAFSIEQGWTEFVFPVGAEERLWEGAHEEVQGRPVSELAGWIQKQNFTTIFSLGQGIWPGSTDPSSARAMDLLEGLKSARRVKDEEEVALVKKLAAMAAQGYQKIKQEIRPGLTEREIQIIYESEVLRSGSEKFPYDSIVGAGSRAAVLHALPTSRKLNSGELVLIDAGADVADYCVDITRVFAVDGQFTTQQKEIYQIVLKAQQSALELCRPGTQWLDVHEASARVIASGLQQLGILKVSVDEAISTEVIRLFYPHGVGHMVGLRVRDVGADLRKEARTRAGVRVRVDLALEEGFMMTAEPGLYFIEALLRNSENRKKFADLVNWSEVEHWMNLGGVRIEDDLVVRKTGPEILTSQIPK